MKIFDENGFVIYVYPNEENERHHAVHIHIHRGSHTGASLVVHIPSLTLFANTMKANDARRAMKFIEENLDEIIRRMGEVV